MSVYGQIYQYAPNVTILKKGLKRNYRNNAWARAHKSLRHISVVTLARSPPSGTEMLRRSKQQRKEIAGVFPVD